MSFQPTASVLFLSLLFLGCSFGLQQKAKKTADETGIPKLRSDLKSIGETTTNQNQIPSAVWPESIRRFNPISLEYHMGGIVIVLKRSGKDQEGLLVMLDPNEDPGGGGSGASYDRLGEGLFWCSEKVRTPFRAPNRTNAE